MPEYELALIAKRLTKVSHPLKLLWQGFFEELQHQNRIIFLKFIAHSLSLDSFACSLIFILTGGFRFHASSNSFIYNE